MPELENIVQNKHLVAVDGSEGSRRALKHAIERAKTSGASLVLLHVIEWSPYSFHTPDELAERHKRREEELDRARTAVLEPMAAEAKAEGVEVETMVRHGRTAETVGAVAGDLHVAQVVVGRRGESGVRAMLFGSVATNLAQTCPVPVLIVP